MPIKKKLADVN